MGTSEDLQVEIRDEMRRLRSVLEDFLEQVGKNTADIRVWKRVSWLLLIGFVGLIVRGAVS